jgi:hypothetical protein
VDDIVADDVFAMTSRLPLPVGIHLVNGDPAAIANLDMVNDVLFHRHAICLPFDVDAFCRRSAIIVDMVASNDDVRGWL